MSMQVKPLTTELSVSPQIEATDIPTIAAMGFKAIICNRPDQEQSAQPEYQAIADAAAANGLQCHHQPFSSGQLTSDLVAEFANLLETVPGPVLAYCRTGTRCAMIWAHSQIHHRTPAEIHNITQQAGYAFELNSKLAIQPNGDNT